MKLTKKEVQLIDKFLLDFTYGMETLTREERKIKDGKMKYFDDILTSIFDIQISIYYDRVNSMTYSRVYDILIIKGHVTIYEGKINLSRFLSYEESIVDYINN